MHAQHHSDKPQHAVLVWAPDIVYTLAYMALRAVGGSLSASVHSEKLLHTQVGIQLNKLKSSHKYVEAGPRWGVM